MRILRHAESHLVELENGSRWRIFPGDLDNTLAWTPETDLAVVELDEGATSHVLVGGEKRVRVIPANQDWPGREVENELKDG